MTSCTHKDAIRGGRCVECGVLASEIPFDPAWPDRAAGAERPRCKYPDTELLFTDDPDYNWHLADAARAARAAVERAP